MNHRAAGARITRAARTEKESFPEWTRWRVPPSALIHFAGKLAASPGPASHSSRSSTVLQGPQGSGASKTPRPPADRVSGEGHLIGMKSRMARAGHFHLDPETKGVGVNVPGAFAEYLKIPAFNAIHLPPEVDDEIAWASPMWIDYDR